MKVFLPLLVCGISIAHGGDDPKYPVSSIPPALRGVADAVVRLHQVRFQVRDESRAVENVTVAFTIFNRSRDDLGHIYLPYSRFTDIDDIEGTLYDASGREIRTLDDDDISDRSAISGYSLYEESRIKSATLVNPEVPYTVEFRYTISYHGYNSWPEWIAQGAEYPVEHTQFEVVLPEGQKLRYWCNADTLKPKIATGRGTTTYYWEANAIPALAPDLRNQIVYDRSPAVKIAPGEFEIEGVKGNMSSWDSFGRWYSHIYRGRDQLPAAAQETVHRLIDSCKSVREKIAVLYRHLQSSTRYVSIQLGLGSWQPLDAASVFERGYGDCKALTNYMMAMLEVAGIASSPVLIQSGSDREPMIVEFPSHQFDHVILCIPTGKDTVWLECTSTSNPVGHLGSFTENRNALLVSSEGGHVVKTPMSPSTENRQERFALIDLESTGKAEARVFETFTGCQRDRVQGALENRSPKDQQRWLINTLDLAQANLSHFETGSLVSRDPDISLVFELDLPRFATMTGNRMFFYPAAMERHTSVPAESKHRRSAVVLPYAYLDTDSLVYMIPSNFAVEALPNEIHLEASFGAFSSCTVTAGENLLLFKRRLEVRSPDVPPDRYDEYRNFFATVAKADRSQVVLVRKAAH